MPFSMFCSWLCRSLLFLTLLNAWQTVFADDVYELRRLQQTRNEKRNAYLNRRALDTDQSTNSTNFRYLNAQTKPYQVTSLPDFEELNLGELYSGTIPVKGTNGSLFFVFKPSINEPVNEVTIWLNGGPGCSSLEGFLEENGPWIWYPGAYKPEVNPYAWSNLTNMLWVEYPFGVGFSTGPTDAPDEETIAAEFVKWFKTWQQTFGIKNYKIYVTGESYGGRYVPYLAKAMLDQKDKTYYNVSGSLIYDGLVGGFLVQLNVPILPLTQRFQNVLNLNSSTISQLQSLDQKCGYAAFRNKYTAFPPSGIQPTQIIPSNVNFSDCDIGYVFYEAISNINPCFDAHAVNVQCPVAWDVLDNAYTGRDAPTPYFNRPAVKKAMHAPSSITWSLCSETVFTNGDNSPQSTLFALPQVINATNRVLLAAGSLDTQLGIDGLLLAIQNMTWNGKLGFQSKPSDPITIDTPDLEYGIGGPQGIMGVQHYERGLMFSGTALATHYGPQGQPRVSLRHLEWMLRRRATL